MTFSYKKITLNSMRLLYFSRFILSALPAHVLLLGVFARKPKMPFKIFIYVLAVCCYWGLVFTQRLSIYGIQHLLFYFCFIPPLLVMLSSENKSIFSWFISDRFFTLFFIMTLAEAVLANTPFVRLLYFYPRADDSSDLVKLFGFYQRPLGISNNPSMTACVLIFSAALSDVLNKLFPKGLDAPAASEEQIERAGHVKIFTFRNFMVTLTILIMASGTGFVLLFIYLFIMWIAQIKFNMDSLIRFVGLGVVIALAVYLSIASTSTNWIEKENKSFDKFSYVYIMIIFKMKMENISSVIEEQNKEVTTMLFGRQVDPNNKQSTTASDFGYYNMFEATGALGMALVLIVPFLFLSTWTKFRVPTIFFFFSFLHYPGLLSPPGAVLFALYIFSLVRYEQSLARRRSVRAIGREPVLA